MMIWVSAGSQPIRADYGSMGTERGINTYWISSNVHQSLKSEKEISKFCVYGAWNNFDVEV